MKKMQSFSVFSRKMTVIYLFFILGRLLKIILKFCVDNYPIKQLLTHSVSSLTEKPTILKNKKNTGFLTFWKFQNNLILVSTICNTISVFLRIYAVVLYRKPIIFYICRLNFIFLTLIKSSDFGSERRKLSHWCSF